MACKGNGILLAWIDIPLEDEHDFNEWYTREHLPERVMGVLGFNRGRRYVAHSGAPKYIALYEADSVAVLQSNAYLALVRRLTKTEVAGGGRRRGISIPT